MMPDINREERRKKRAPVGAFIASSTVVISLLLFPPDWQWVPLAIGTSAAIAVGASIDMVGGRGRGNGLTGRGRGRVLASPRAAEMTMTSAPARPCTSGAC
jgi:hypothetical protein